MKITLTPQQKLQLEQMHDIERDSRVCDRIRGQFGYRELLYGKPVF